MTSITTKPNSAQPAAELAVDLFDYWCAEITTLRVAFERSKAHGALHSPTGSITARAARLALRTSPANASVCAPIVRPPPAGCVACCRTITASISAACNGSPSRMAMSPRPRTRPASSAPLSLLPRTMLIAATGGVLVSDATRFAECASRAGVMIDLKLFDDSVHAFPLFAEFSNAEDAIVAIGAFVQACRLHQARA